MEHDIEKAEIEPTEAERAEMIPRVGKTRKSFSKIGIELSEDDLKNPGVQKLLLAEISNLEQEVFKLESFKDQFHEVDKSREVLKEKQKTFLFAEILYSVSLTVGSLLIGLTPSLKSADGSNSYITLGVGVALIIGAVLSKVVRR